MVAFPVRKHSPRSRCCSLMEKAAAPQRKALSAHKMIQKRASWERGHPTSARAACWARRQESRDIRRTLAVAEPTHPVGSSRGSQRLGFDGWLDPGLHDRSALQNLDTAFQRCRFARFFPSAKALTHFAAAPSMLPSCSTRSGRSP